jgi:hypothetical protein
MDQLLKLIKKVPVIGCLVDIPIQAQKEAAFEMIISITFSTLPIWILTLVLGTRDHIIDRTCQETFSHGLGHHIWAAFKDSVANGELFMLSAAILGPVLYLGFRNFGKKETEIFPSIRSQMFIFVVISLVSTALFLLLRLESLESRPELFNASLWIYGICIALLFPSMAHNQQGLIPDLIPKTHKDLTESFAKEYSQRRHDDGN